MTELYDVAIVGAGDVGSAIARELSAFDLRLALIDSGDVGAGTSKANTAILHTGFDAEPGTLEARLVTRGHALLSRYAGEAGIPLEEVGAVLVAWNEHELAALPGIAAKARSNGYTLIEELSADELYRKEPRLGAEALGALHIPGESIVCPWTSPLAWASQALAGGADLMRFTKVTGLAREDSRWRLETTAGPRLARWIINAAGLHSDDMHRLAGYDGLTITPRRGELIVFDKLARSLLQHIVLPVPTATTKGVLVAPTVFGNILLGPTAEDITDKSDTACTSAGLAYLRAQGANIVPDLLAYEVTSTYAGLRAASDRGDYLLLADGARGYACAAGIRSTGLSAAMAIAEWMRDETEREGLELRPRASPPPPPRMPNIGDAAPRPFTDRALIEGDGAYGDIVCFCERVTRGELRDAASGALPARDLDGLRRRTRAMTGRCQGFYCADRVAAELASARGVRSADPWWQA